MSEIILSIVTVCKNSELTIRETLNSVLRLLNLNQSVEYIIQDSLSKDSTLSIIKEFSEKKIANFNVFSEADKGLYDGMNKALTKCKGKYVLFLNSDDILLSQFNYYLEEFFKNQNADFFIAPVIFFKRPNYKIKRIFLPNTNLANPFNNLVYSYIPAHPGFICGLEYLKKNKFNLKYKIAADYEQILKIMSNNKYKKKYFSKPCVAMAMGGRSNTLKGFKIAMREMIIINHEFDFNEKLFIRYFRNFLQYFLPFFLGKRFKLRQIERELKFYKKIY
tara:strand:+ start:205 stop:1035 length:831 start_codon:yes stop_codon:yes gene_type:complete